MNISGEGTVEKVGKNSYRIRFSLGKDPVTKKYKNSPWRNVRGTKTDVRRALDEYRKEIEGGLRVDLKDLTFSEFAYSFVKEREELGILSKQTIEGDYGLINKHLNKYLGKLPVSEITTDHLKNMLVKLAQDENVSQNRLHDIVIKVKQIFNEAVLADIILRSPAIKLRTPKRPKPKRNSLKSNQVSRLLSVLETYPLDRNIIAVYIGVATGMRRGEVLALKWEDVDLDDCTIYVNFALDINKTRKKPKTDAGIRRISIDALTTEKLSEWKEIQRDSLNKFGVQTSNETYVCSNRHGEATMPGRFYKWFKDFCVDNDFGVYTDADGNILPKKHYNENGFPIDEHGRPYTRSNKKPKISKHYKGLKFHELRHTHATLLVANGVDIKTVQSRLGHSRSSMTLDFYAHAQEEQDRKAADLFSNLISA